MNIDWWKSPDKMSEQELRAEVREWRQEYRALKPMPHCEAHTGFTGYCQDCHAMNPLPPQRDLPFG